MQRFARGPLGGVEVLVALAWSCAGSAQGGGSGHTTTVTAPETYGTQSTASWSPPPDLASLYDAARAAGTQAGRTLVPDHGLAETALAIAERVARDSQHRQPTVRAIQALEWRAGVIDPLPAVIVTQVSGNAPLTDLSHSLADLARESPFNVVGMARANASGGLSIVVAAIAERRVQMTLPIARRVAIGTHVHLNGHLSDGLRSPELSITHPDGQNEHFPLGDGPDFMSQFPLPTRGAYQIELVAIGDGGDTVLANFPVYADMDPPATPEDMAVIRSEDPAAAERELYQFLNEARHAAGKPPLQLMPSLTNVARAHSQDMAANHFIAHNSPRSGTPSDRIHHAGLQSGSVLENVGRGYSAREMHDSLMESPGHRANILSDHATHVGIGVAPDPGAQGGLVLTEDFIEVGAAIDLTSAANTLLDQVNSARTRRGALAVTTRPQLMDVAGSAARNFFQNPRDSQQAVVDRANREVSRFGLIFRRVAVLATVVTRTTDASGLEPLFDPAIRAIGIGVAQGSRPDTPPNAVFVVFVLGYPR